MPLALLATLSVIPSPSLVLIDEDSMLNRHISAIMAPRLGYMLRTFTTYLSDLQSGRIRFHPAPNINLAIHRDLGSLKFRLADEAIGSTIAHIWNHVENTHEEDLLDIMTNPPTRMFSATISFHGCPGAVGILTDQDKRSVIIEAAAAFGLDCLHAVQTRDTPTPEPAKDPTRI